MKFSNRAGAGRASSAFKATVLSMLATCSFVLGCGGTKTIWSEKSSSPDGKVVASVDAIARNQGLSIISGVDSNVYLNWTTGSKHPMMILELADGSDTPVDTHVEMNWLTPNHLELVYKGNQTVVFQAVKWVDIDITVRNLVSSYNPLASSTSASR